MIDADRVMISSKAALPALVFSNLQATYSSQHKKWIISRDKVTRFKREILQKNDKFLFEDIPQFVDKILQPIPNTIIYEHKKKIFRIQFPNETATLKDLPKNFQEKLYNFQKDGVRFGLKNRGRVLIADEMGVGKTAQALALASLYKAEWPFIVFVPSSLRLVWKEEILQWFPELCADEVQVLEKSSDGIRKKAKAVIVSYDLGARMRETIEDFEKFGMAIADEAYYLKNSGAKRTESVLPLIRNCTRCVLLAGTPVLARPKEIYNLLHIIRPDVFNNIKEFGKRYCSPQLSKFSGGMEYTGANNLEELNYILRNSVMIRRLKQDVLQELPTKIRQKIEVEVDKKYVALIQEVLNNKFGGRMSQLSDLLEELLKSVAKKSQSDSQQENDIEEEELKFPKFFDCYRYSGLAKLEAVKKYLKDMLEDDTKILVFAHHTAVLDGIEEQVQVLGVKYIRIDGSVPSGKRYERVQEFQEDEDVKVAILSLTSAGSGLTLTAASKVIFAEMYWTPAIMLQAEDRIHRIGQKEKTGVNYYYLYGEDTLDSILYKMLENKVRIVSKMVEGKTNLNRDEYDCENDTNNGEMEIEEREERGDYLIEKPSRKYFRNPEDEDETFVRRKEIDQERKKKISFELEKEEMNRPIRPYFRKKEDEDEKETFFQKQDKTEERKKVSFEIEEKKESPNEKSHVGDNIPWDEIEFVLQTNHEKHQKNSMKIKSTEPRNQLIMEERQISPSDLRSLGWDNIPWKKINEVLQKSNSQASIATKDGKNLNSHTNEEDEAEKKERFLKIFRETVKWDEINKVLEEDVRVKNRKEIGSQRNNEWDFFELTQSISSGSQESSTYKSLFSNDFSFKPNTQEKKKGKVRLSDDEGEETRSSFFQNQGMNPTKDQKNIFRKKENFDEDESSHTQIFTDFQAFKNNLSQKGPKFSFEQKPKIPSSQTSWKFDKPDPLVKNGGSKVKSLDDYNFKKSSSQSQKEKIQPIEEESSILEFLLDEEVEKKSPVSKNFKGFEDGPEKNNSKQDEWEKMEQSFAYVPSLIGKRTFEEFKPNGERKDEILKKVKRNPRSQFFL